MKQFKVLIIFLTCLQMLLIFNYLFSKEYQLTLREAIKLAIENNKDLKIQKMNIEKAKAEVNEANGHAFPSLDLTSNFTHFIQKPIVFFPDFQAYLNNSTYGILFRENLLQPDNSKFLPYGLSKMSFVLSNQFENKIQLNQIIFNSIVFQGIKATKIYLEISKANYQSFVSKLIALTKKSYYLSVLLKEVNQIYKESLQNASEHLDNIRSLYEQGLVSEFDLLQAEVRFENLIPNVQNTENEYFDAVNNLKLLLGLPIEDTLVLTDQIDYFEYNLPNLNDIIQAVLKDNWEIKTLEFKRKVDEEMVQLYKSENYPSITAFASYSFAGQSNNLNFNSYSQSMVGVQLSINLFNGFQTKSRIEKSTLEYKQTEEQLQMLRQFVTKDMISKVQNFQKAKRQIESQKKNIELAKKAYEIAQTRYKEGLIIQLELKNAELELRQAKINYKKAIFDYLISIVDIENLLGKVNYE